MRDEPRGIAAVLRHRLEHDAILVCLRIDRRDLTLAEGVVQRVVHGLQAHAEPAGGHAIDLDLGAQAAVLRLRCHLFQLGRLLELGHEPLRPFVDLGRVGADERVLILRAARARRDLHVLHRLEVDGDAGNGVGHLGQALDDRADELRALIARLQHDLEARDVGRRVELCRRRRQRRRRPPPGPSSPHLQPVAARWSAR